MTRLPGAIILKNTLLLLSNTTVVTNIEQNQYSNPNSQYSLVSGQFMFPLGLHHPFVSQLQSLVFQEI